MEIRVLTDEKIFPTEEVLSSHLGKAYPLWQSFFTDMHAAHPECAEEWRYYNDGKSWLMKITRKKKTVVWLAVYSGMFRITAYFTDKARAAVIASTLSEACKEQFLKGKKIGKLVGITVTFKKKADVKDGLALIALKASMK
jgi:hypothetical protein